jgi:hypothetical protein
MKIELKDLKKLTRDIDAKIDHLEELYKAKKMSKEAVKEYKKWYYLSFGCNPTDPSK